MHDFRIAYRTHETPLHRYLRNARIILENLFIFIIALQRAKRTGLVLLRLQPVLPRLDLPVRLELNSSVEGLFGSILDKAVCLVSLLHLLNIF